jgi:hypothetical protein
MPGEYDRPEALAELAPYLPAGLFGAALDVVRGVRNAPHRASALAELSPYLPADQLEPAMAITDDLADWRVRPVAALLARARELWLAGDASAPPRLVTLVRHALRHGSRAECLALGNAVGAIIGVLGGAEAVAGCVDAVRAAH